MNQRKQRTAYEKALITEYFGVGWNILEGIKIGHTATSAI